MMESIIIYSKKGKFYLCTKCDEIKDIFELPGRYSNADLTFFTFVRYAFVYSWLMSTKL